MTAQRRLYLASALILVVGWIAAALVFTTATRSSADTSGALAGQTATEQLDAAVSRSERLALERMGGQANVWAAEFNAWLGSLWHGVRLSYTLALLSTVLAAACAGLARLMDDNTSA